MLIEAQLAARSDDSEQLGEGTLCVGDRAQGERAQGGIDAGVRQRQILPSDADESHVPAICRTAAAGRAPIR